MDQETSLTFAEQSQRMDRIEVMLRSLTRQVPVDDINRRFRIFPAKYGSSPKQFQEQVSSAGEMIEADTTQDRHCGDDTLFCQLRDDDEVIWVYEAADPNGGANARAFYVMRGGAQRLQIVGNRTCGGAYSVLTTTTVPEDFDTTQSSFDDDDIADETADGGTFVNLNEQGTTDHSLTESPQTLVFVWGHRAGVDDEGRPKWEGHVVDLVDCPSEGIAMDEFLAL